MVEFELFLSTWRNTALFGFSLASLIYTVIRIRAYLKSRMDQIIEEAVATALIDQRQNFQAEAIDELLKVIDKQADANINYCETMQKYSKEAAMVNLLLSKNNIKVK